MAATRQAPPRMGRGVEGELSYRRKEYG